MEEKLESMKNIIIGIIVIFTLHMMASQTVSAQQPDFSLTNQEAQPIYAILFDILSNNRESVVKHIFYPFERSYPLAPIKNANEMLAYYDNVFTDDVIKNITKNSEIWSIGWRGINIGDCLFGDFYDDGFKIYAVNYDSPQEQSLANQTIEKQRAQLHPSIREFIIPMDVIHTSKYIIIIHKVKEGDDEESFEDDVYRYACWKANKELIEEPDLILYNGVLKLEGTMQLFKYTFTNGIYKYIVDQSFGLEVYKNNKLILQDDIKSIE